MSVARAAFLLLRDASQRKHLVRWFRSLKKDYCLDTRQPWLVFDARDYLHALPLEGKSVFEYGSGGSTLYWLSRAMQCVSIEHDPGWHEAVAGQLKAAEKKDHRLVQPQKSDATAVGDAADPLLYGSGDPRFRGVNFRDYASRIDEFPDRHFDVVLIDGRARPSCIMHGAGKVAVGGMLILDDADRPYYVQKTGRYLRDFRCRSFCGYGPGLCQRWTTNIYVRQR